MKTICALIAACLALQACNDQSGTPSASVNISEHSTDSEYTAAASLRDAEYSAALAASAITAFDDYLFIASDAAHLTDDEYVPTTSAISAIKPIDGAEFEGTSRDDAYTPWSALPTGPLLDDYAFNWSMDTDDHDAAVISPAIKAAEDKSVTTEPALYFDDDGFGSTLPARIDQHAVQATDG
jgi:hypothetical protein